MDFSEIGNAAPKIDYQFIVVYDDKHKPVAKSLHNQAVKKRIKSTTWSRKDYLQQESRLTNHNHLVFLSDSLIKQNLANPHLEEEEVIPGVLYKHEGNSLGFYLDSNADLVETAKKVGKSLKEDWLYEAGAMIAGGLIGVGISSVARFFSKQRKAAIYLAFRGVDEFAESILEDFVSDRLP